VAAADAVAGTFVAPGSYMVAVGGAAGSRLVVAGSRTSVAVGAAAGAAAADIAVGSCFDVVGGAAALPSLSLPVVDTPVVGVAAAASDIAAAAAAADIAAAAGLLDCSRSERS